MIFRSKYFDYFYVFLNRKAMKTAGFLFIVCLLLSLTLSAQTTKEFKPDSLTIGLDSFQHNFGYSLKLGNPFEENKLRLPFQSNKFPNQNQNFARIGSNSQTLSDQYFRMPVVKPEVQSNMPVMKPDSSIHFHLLIQKIRK